MKFYNAFIIGLLLLGKLSFSQGCSDAGVCSVGSLGLIPFKYELLPSVQNKLSLMEEEDPDLIITLNGKTDTIRSAKPDLPKKNPGLAKNDSTSVSSDQEIKAITLFNPRYIIQLTANYGLGDNRTSVSVFQLEGNMRIKQQLFAQIKLPYTFISGNLGNNNGLGDITLSLSYISKNNFSISGGVKIPTNKANFTNNNLPLPMVYQTSLGSVDFLGGIKYTKNKWDLTLGYQHSFNETNNQYLPDAAGGNTTYNSYFASRMLKRSDDGIFRINRNFKIKKIKAGTGLLFIYHLADDKITNARGERVKVEGSGGLTLNFNMAGVVSVSKKIDIAFTFAAPLIIRKSRPDGLTRIFVTILGLKYNLY